MYSILSEGISAALLMKTSNDPPVILATSAAADWNFTQCASKSEDGRSPHMKSLRPVQITRNDVNIGTGELLQLVRRVRIADNGKDVILRVAFLRTMRSTSVQVYE